MLRFLLAFVLSFTAIAPSFAETGATQTSTSTATTQVKAGTQATNSDSNTPTSTGKIDRFQITTSAQVKIGEKVDVTIKALTKDGSVKGDYLGTIFFTIENDSRAEYPFPDGYTFLPTDKGTRVFSKGLSFTSEGKKKITVFDIETDSVQGSFDVTVSSGGSSQGSSGEIVQVLTPEANSTLASTTVDIAGTTKKNSKVEIWVNDVRNQEVPTDDKGTFFLKVKDLKSGNNTIEVRLLDGTNKNIGSSGKIAFTVTNDAPKFIKAQIKQGTEVSAGSQLTVEVQAETKLKEVTISLGDATVPLAEGTAGIYTGSITAPTQTGSFALGVVLKNTLGKVATESAAATVEVSAPTILFKNVKTLTQGDKVTFGFEVEWLPKTTDSFIISYLPENGTGVATDIKTLAPAKILSGSTYSWYVPNLVPNKYTFTISAADASGVKIADATSEALPVDLSLNAAATCTIGNITGISVTKKGNTSVLSWNRIPEALSYNVYKKDASGAFVFIENVAKESYTVYIQGKQVAYNDFAIKALCSDGKALSADYGLASKVQTGPGFIVAILVLASILAFVYQRRSYFFG